MMHTTRQQLLSSATRRARRARRTTGRILVSALGFGMAYCFDAEHGQARRKQLQRWQRRTARSIDSVLTSEVGDAPPVFYPVWPGLRALEPDSLRPAPAETAAR